jgi:hypothetical protein
MQSNASCGLGIVFGPPHLKAGQSIITEGTTDYLCIPPPACLIGITLHTKIKSDEFRPTGWRPSGT